MVEKTRQGKKTLKKTLLEGDIMTFFFNADIANSSKNQPQPQYSENPIKMAANDKVF